MNWQDIIKEESTKDYYKKLQKTLDKKYKNSNIFPSRANIFRAFEITAFLDVKVVILGQDPYHKEKQAQGLSFSTPSHIKNPPSMRNILKEIKDDLKKESSCLNGDLEIWAKQGVLLLNTILSVEEGKPKSHHKIGWEIFTDKIIQTLSENRKDIVFILWGANAIKKEKLIDLDKHCILKGVHPSPLSAYRGFFSSKVFSKTNTFLESKNKQIISW